MTLMLFLEMERLQYLRAGSSEHKCFLGSPTINYPSPGYPVNVVCFQSLQQLLSVLLPHILGLLLMFVPKLLTQQDSVFMKQRYQSLELILKLCMMKKDSSWQY
jgi:hypothetical protein